MSEVIRRRLAAAARGRGGTRPRGCRRDADLAGGWPPAGAGRSHDARGGAEGDEGVTSRPTSDSLMTAPASATVNPRPRRWKLFFGGSATSLTTTPGGPGASRRWTSTWLDPPTPSFRERGGCCNAGAADDPAIRADPGCGTIAVQPSLRVSYRFALQADSGLRIRCRSGRSGSSSDECESVEGRLV